MQKHIVFVMGKYVPESTANVNCIKNVVQVLKEQNYRVSIVSVSNIKTGTDIVDNASVHRIKYIDYASKLRNCKSKIRKSFLIIWHFIKSVFLLPFYPNVTPLISYKVYKNLIDIQNSEGIDCVIGVFRPYFSINALLRFKRKFPNIPAIGYYLDVMMGANKPLGSTQWLFEKLCYSAQKRDFSQLDKIFLPECSKMYYEIDLFSPYKDKIVYLNFPTLLKENYTGETQSTSMNLVYAGTTNSIFRNPKRAIEIFIKLKKRYPKLKFHLYGPSDMAHELKQLEKHAEGAFIYHGAVSKNEADAALQQADYCINFGNNVSGIVPSKIFELISSGKSIVHFTPGITDASLEYLKKYPKAHIIDYNKSDEEIISEMTNIFQIKRTDIDYNIIEQLFYSATPKAVSDKIIEIIA